MAVEAILRMQQAFSVVATLMLTAYLFPKQALVEDFNEFDFIVVGAGSAGSVVADRLSECPWYSVLVIDAGGDPPVESLMPALFSYLPHTKYDWNFTSVNDNYTAQSHTIKALNLTCGRVLGGGSSVNYLMYVRGCRGDYDSWARAAQDDTWSYQNVLPYFIKSERLEDAVILKSSAAIFHGTSGFLGITRESRQETYKYLDAFKEAGNNIVFDVNGKNSIGYTLPLFTIADGIRQTTAYTNLGVNKGRTNLHVLKNTLVTEILFDKDNNAIGVKAMTADDRELKLLARREVIISAGALNTPKLLMLSGVGPKEHLQSLNISVRSDLPVGMNLQDHASVLVAFKMERSTAPPKPLNPHQVPIPVVVGYATINKSRTCAEYQVFNDIVPNDSEVPYQLCTFKIGLEESLCRHLLEAGKGRNMMLGILNILHPKSRGRVTLRSKNPYEPPIVNLRTFSEVEDLEDFTSYLQDYVQVVNTTYFRSVGAEIVDFEIDRCKGLQFGSREYWRCYALNTVSTMFHYAGTAALGAVLDSWLCVRGVQRLRVADNSAMPTLTSGNTNAPAILIGEMAADMIKLNHPMPALFSYLPHTKYDWNFTSVNDNYTAQSHTIKALNLTCGRVLGGGSSMNYMLYVRGCHGDYDSWARAAQDDTWSYQNVLPYFIKSERLEDAAILKSSAAIFHGTSGFLGITRESRQETYKYLDAFKEAGNKIVFDVNGKNSIGYTLPLFTIADGIRQTTAYTNLGVNKGRKNLHVLKNTLVTEILFDKDNNAIGVKVMTGDDRELTLLARKEVIISAGALNTPKLLMLSGVGPKEHLQSLNISVRSDLPVGMNLQDHALVEVAFKMEKSNAPPKPLNPHQFPIPLVVGYATVNKSRTCAEYQVFNYIVPNDSEVPYELCTFNIGLEESLCRHLLEAGKGRNMMLGFLNILHPKSRGRVTLRSKNPYEPPIVNLRTFSEVEDLEDFTSYLQDYVQVVNTTYFRSVGAEIVDFEIDRCQGLQFGSRQYWRCYALNTVSTMFHYAGTAALGAVLDSCLRVRGVQRLRVADNSAMPTLTSGNTNAPAILIGEIAADMIKLDHPVHHYKYIYNFL